MTLDRERWSRRLAEPPEQPTTRSQQICDLCVEMLGMSGAGISLVTSTGNHGIVCVTDALSAEIERLQLTLGEGPCVDAARGQMPVLVPDLAQPLDIVVERWPVFLGSALASGVGAVFAFPMLIGAVTVGVLDLYRASPGELSDGELPAALLAADAAALAMLDLDLDATGGGAGGAELTPSFYNPLLHQATGMVMVQLGVGTQEAFLALRARAFATGRPLSAIAADLVERKLRLSKEDT